MEPDPSDLPDYSSSPSTSGCPGHPLNTYIGNEASSSYEPDGYLNQLKRLEDRSSHRFKACFKASSHDDKNIWVPGPFEDVEDVHRYCPGGYHPILIGDFLGPLRRFRVAHKLGYGYFGTVWLCYDYQEILWRAVKILTADSSYPNCPELAAIECLSDTDPGQLMNKHMGVPIEHFWIDGPNGRHLCLVMPLLGPRVRDESDVKSDPLNQLAKFEEDNPEIYVDISFQITQALHFMHSKGLCHGDLRPMNILMQYSGVDTMKETELMRLMDEPGEKRCVVWHGEGRKPDRYPEYLVPPADQSRLSKFIIPKVAVVDFGLSYPATDGFTPESGLPCNFSAPEMLFFGPNGARGIPTDIWSLACTISAVVTGDSPFCEYVRNVFEDLEMILGPLPEPYRMDWKEHWDIVYSRWGVKPPSEEYMQEHWKQDPEPGEAMAPVTTSTKQLADKRENWTSGSRYKDVLQCRFSLENHSIAKVENSISPNDIPQDYYSPKYERYCFDQQSCQQNDQWQPAPTVNQSELNEFRDTKNFRVGNATATSKPGIESLTAFVLEQPKQQQGYERRIISNTALETHDTAATTQENTATPAKSECSSDYDSLLDVCEPTKPHWSEIYNSKPKSPLSYLQPSEVHKAWTDDSGAIHTVTRMAHGEVLTLTDLIRKMLRYDPMERIDTAAVLNHKWFGDRGKGFEDLKVKAKTGPWRNKESRKRKAVKNRTDVKVMGQLEEPKPKLRRSARIASMHLQAANKEG